MSYLQTIMINLFLTLVIVFCNDYITTGSVRRLIEETTLQSHAQLERNLNSARASDRDYLENRIPLVVDGVIAARNQQLRHIDILAGDAQPPKETPVK